MVFAKILSTVSVENTRSWSPYS